MPRSMQYAKPSVARAAACAAVVLAVGVMCWAGTVLETTDPPPPTISLAVDSSSSISDRQVILTDYSESGRAFAFDRIAPAEFDVFIRPSLRDVEVLDFAVSNGDVADVVTFHVHNAPAEVSPEYTQGQFQWSPVDQVQWVGDVLTIRQHFTGAHAVLRLRPLVEPEGDPEYYNLADMEAYLASISGDPHTTVEIIGWSYQNRPEIDRPIYKVTINDMSVPDDEKLPILILCRHHGNEFAANYILEGMIEFIAGRYRPDLRPDDLLDKLSFIFYPMVNPDGVEAGSWGERGNRNGVDLNREWNHNGSGPDEEWEVRHIHSDIEVFHTTNFYTQAIDLHGSQTRQDLAGYRFGLGLPPASVPAPYYNNQQSFFEIQESINPWRPEENFTENGATVGMSRYCMYRQYNVDIHTSETPDQLRSPPDLIEEGPLHILSFYEYLLSSRFTDGSGTEVDAYVLDNDPAFIRVTDFDENENAALAETVNVIVTNSANSDQEAVTLTETGIDTGVFASTAALLVTSAPFDSSRVGDGVVQTVAGARLSITYVDDDFTQSVSWDFADVLASLMQMQAPVPGRAGEVNTLTLTGAQPGAVVWFGYALDQGATPIPMCPGGFSGLADPVVIGSAIADANGEASISRFVPGGAGGKIVLLQGIDIANCQLSNVAVVQF